MNKVIGWVSIAVCPSLSALCVYALWKCVTTDNQIKGCYFRTDEFDRRHILVVGNVPWGLDIILGGFDKYEDAEAAMAKYKACQNK